MMKMVMNPGPQTKDNISLVEKAKLCPQDHMEILLRTTLDLLQPGCP